LGCVLAALQVEAVDGDALESVFQNLPPDEEFKKVTEENSNLTARAKEALENLKDNPESLPYLNGAKTILKDLESSRKKLMDLRNKYQASNKEITSMLRNNQNLPQTDIGQLRLVLSASLVRINSLKGVEEDNSILLEKMPEAAPDAMTEAVGNVMVDGKLYSVEFEDDVTAENLNESDVTPYIERIMDTEGNTLDLAGDSINDITNVIKQNTENSGGELCFTSDGAAQPTAVCDAADV